MTCCSRGPQQATVLNSCRKVSSTGFSTSPHAPSILSRSEPHCCTTHLGARAALKTDCKKLFAVRRRCGKTSAQGGVWHRRLALNGGQDGLVLLAGTECTAASCSAAQRVSLRIVFNLQLQRIDELVFNHSSRADAVLLSRGVDEHRLMNSGAESALQARSCSRPIAS